MKHLFYIVSLMAASMFVTSCFQSTVFDSYAHTPIAGWEKNDTLSFEVPPMEVGGLYRQEIGIRTTRAYPFTGLTLIINQNIYPNSKKRGFTTKTDTVYCEFFDKNGTDRGQGISYHQYNFPINVYQINEGDSIHIAIRHDMKREILPGISDVGIKIVKNE